jgi:hypothetical protein
MTPIIPTIVELRQLQAGVVVCHIDINSPCADSPAIARLLLPKKPTDGLAGSSLKKQAQLCVETVLHMQLHNHFAVFDLPSEASQTSLIRVCRGANSQLLTECLGDNPLQTHGSLIVQSFVRIEESIGLVEFFLRNLCNVEYLKPRFCAPIKTFLASKCLSQAGVTKQFVLLGYTVSRRRIVAGTTLL